MASLVEHCRSQTNKTTCPKAQVIVRHVEWLYNRPLAVKYFADLNERLERKPLATHAFPSCWG